MFSFKLDIISTKVDLVTKGRAASCISTISGGLFERECNPAKEDFALVSPPVTIRISLLSLIISDINLSSLATTIIVSSIKLVEFIDEIVCSINRFPANLRYCLGIVLLNRAPFPAATIICAILVISTLVSAMNYCAYIFTVVCTNNDLYAQNWQV